MSRVVDLDTLAASEKYTDTVIFNGVNGDTGSYLFEDSDAQTVAEIARQEDRNVVTDNTLNRRHEIDTDEHLGLISGDRDADKVAEAGWALIAGRDVDPAVLEALSPLRDHRRRQAGQLYREYCDPESALRTGESRLDFLLRHGVSPFDAADPGEMPYYVLLIGGPDQIPFEFQYGLSVQRAVGRIDFDFAQDYAQYAENVVAAEQSAGNKDARRLDVFAPQNDYDIATALSSRRLAEPLINELRKGSDPPDITEAIGEQATKRRLDTVMRGSAIDVLLTATHGFGVTGERQRDLQGALVCQDWRNAPLCRRPEPDTYFSATDISSSDRVAPRIVVSFACFSAGTPHLTYFPDHPDSAASAARPFVARLPQHLLAHPKGDCLAYIGHVDRAWAYSFLWKSVHSQILPFVRLAASLLDGRTVGFALDDIAQRRAGVNYELLQLLDDIKRAGRIVGDKELADLWLTYHDTQSFVIIGDPAVRARQPATE